MKRRCSGSCAGCRNYAVKGFKFCKRCELINGRKHPVKAKAKPRRKKSKPLPRNKYQAYIASDAWRQKSEAARRRADHRCSVCGAEGNLETHHLTYERLGNERPEDLTVLCRACHSLEHEDKHLALDPISREFRSMF